VKSAFEEVVRGAMVSGRHLSVMWWSVLRIAVRLCTADAEITSPVVAKSNFC